MFELFSARSVTNVLTFIMIPPYCIQINSNEGEGRSVCALMCMRMHVCKELKWVGMLVWAWGGWLTDNLPIHMNKFEQ